MGEPQKPGESAVSPKPFTLEAEDGFKIKGFSWRHSKEWLDGRPVVIINPATSVRCRYYFRFAVFLFEHGFDVIAYDYRGIGESRPETLRGFNAGWLDWGSLDFNAVLRYAEGSFSGQPIHVVAHSVGGLVLGLAKSNHLIRRVFTMGAQYAYWRDYAPGSRLRMILKWHVIMPILTIPFGYFPGKRLGWLEDTPKGVVRDWVFSRRRLEDAWRSLSSPEKEELLKRFASLTAPTLAVSVTDDEFGTVPAVERLLSYFIHSRRTHLRISPKSIEEVTIGHFGFFNSRFKEKLWGIPLEWLMFGRLPTNCPGVLVTPENRIA
ncbi:MAG TPA: alpha/beta fold hydrolase [Thermodesulfobacteriota bacterium]|nr:alpha/beta fold hydrolase [Thermodesulfobacteriota bacterium]